MSDNWEVVGGGKIKRPKIPNGQPKQQVPITKTAPVVTKGTQKIKKKKHIGPRENKIAPLPGTEIDEEVTEAKIEPTKSKKQTSSAAALKTNKSKETKSRDLEVAIKSVSAPQLQKFYEELRSAGSGSDVYLSWIKYSADALNAKLNHIPLPTNEASLHNYPHDLDYPELSKSIYSAINYIISQTAVAREDVDVIGLSFSSLVGHIPTLVQRNDAGWGFLLFLRQMCIIDPELVLRRGKSLEDIMKSYGNIKEVGTCMLWISAQAALHSDSLLKIVLTHILPFYSFRHYKNLVLTILSFLASSSHMGSGENVVDPQDFEEFFEMAFDPKKKREFEKFYPHFKNLALQNIRGKSDKLFFRFLEKIGDKSFMPLSAYGQEIFDILHSCLSNDSSLVDKWREKLQKYSKESTILLNYLSKRPEAISYSKKLESSLIQSNEFAIASVKTPELLRIAKKLQSGFERVEASKKKFPWKMSCLVLLLLIFGLIWLDIMENGKGSLDASETGKLLGKLGLLEGVKVATDAVTTLGKKGFQVGRGVVGNLYEALRPMLSALEEKIHFYIPQLNTALSSLSDYVISFANKVYDFCATSVFVGELSPENLRKLTKKFLTFLWVNANYALSKLYEGIEYTVSYAHSKIN